MIRETLPPPDLPIWMRRALRMTDWGALLSILFSLLIALPMLLQPGLPVTNASEHYVYQTANTATALTEGRLWPRWAPHALAGYGAPIPHYYAQGASYAAAVTQLILTGDPMLAVQVVSGFAMAVAGIAAYSFVARRAGAAPALLANLLYSFSPYVALTAPHMLGDVPGVIAHALLPLLLWAVDRLLSARQTLDLFTTTLLGAALILMDMRYAAIGGALVLAYAGWYFWACERQAPWQTVWFALFLAAGITSFFWLPALIEHDGVMWRSVTLAPSYALSPATLFLPLRQTDPAELIPRAQFTLGIPLLVFTMASTLWIWIVRGWRTVFALFLAFAVLLALLALVWLPKETWLLGPISLCASVAAAGCIRLQRRFQRRRRWLLAILGSLVIMTSTLPIWLYPYGANGSINASPAAQVQYELQGFGVAGLPPGLALPTMTGESLLPNRALINSYTAGEIAHVDTLYLNSDVQLGFLEQTSHSSRLQVQAYAATSVNVLIAYFPGWRVTTNAGPVTLSQDADTGLMHLDIPEPLAGELNISFESIPIRALAWGTSWGTLGALLLISRRRARRSEAYMTDYPLLTTTEAQKALVLWLALAALAGLATIGVLDSLRTRPNQTLTVTAPVRARTDTGLELTSFRIDQPSYRPGDTLSLTIYWRALRFLEENYRIRVSLVDPIHNQAFYTTGFQHPGQYPTRRWSASRFVADSYVIPLPTDIQSTRYLLRVEVFACASVCDDDGRLSFFGETGVSLGQSVLLPAWIEVAR